MPIWSPKTSPPPSVSRAASPRWTRTSSCPGLPDYLIRVQVADLAAYGRWLPLQLMGDPAIARVGSRLTMKLVKTRGTGL